MDENERSALPLRTRFLSGLGQRLQRLVLWARRGGFARLSHPWWLWLFLARRTSVGRHGVGVGARLRFYARRFAHHQRERAHLVKIGSGSTWALVRIAIMPLIFAMAAVAILSLPQTSYGSFGPALGLPRLALPGFDDSTYSTLLATVAGAAASVLALFFTALSVVASTTYAKVTTEVRLLVAQDPWNRRYLQLLAHTATVATLALILRAVGVPGSIRLLGYVGALSSLAMLSFIPLGIRTFSLFDPAALAAYPTGLFERAVRRVTNAGAAWLDPSFQDHARRTAEAQIRLLEDLVSFALTDNRSRHDTILELVQRTHLLARFHAFAKAHIPSDSLWFPRRAQFQRWQVVSSAESTLALGTGVGPSPQPVPDHSFIESRTASTTADCLKYLLEREALDDAARLLEQVNATSTTYAAALLQADALELVAKMQAPILDRLKATDTSASTLKHLGIIDLLCVSALAPILYTSRALTETSTEHALSLLSEPLLKRRSRSLYDGLHPRRALKEAEDLQRRLDLEFDAEGSIRTQPWFVNDMLALAYAEVVRDTIQGISTVVSRCFASPAAELVAARRGIWAAVWLQRGLEACSKAQQQIAALDEVYENLKTLHVTESPWHPSGGDTAQAAVEKARAQFIRLLAEVVPDLCAAPGDTKLPDMLGQARAWIAEELVNLMDTKQDAAFRELFVAYFNASLAVHDYFIGLSKEPGRADYVRAGLDALLDLMDVSGLALIFSELDGTPFGATVRAAWDHFLSKSPNPKATVQVLYAPIDMKLGLPIFSSSAMQRQSWSQRLAKALAARGLRTDRHEYTPGVEYEPNPNPVIESIHVFMAHTMSSPHEYFGALYLAKLESAGGLPVPRAIAGRIDSIEHARERIERGRNAPKKNQPGG